MAKRVTALALWFLAGWTLGGFLAWLIGIPESVPILFGVGAAVVPTVNPTTSLLRIGGQAGDARAPGSSPIETAS